MAGTELNPAVDTGPDAATLSVITQLILHERQGRDRGWWEQMAACFLPDSLVSLSWFNGSGPDFVAQSRTMSDSGLRTVHRLSPPVVHIAGRRGFVEVPAAVELRFPVSGVDADLTSHSRLLYRVENRAAAWKVLSLTAIYERDTLTPAIPGATLDIDITRFSRFREPYRCLAYQVSLRGQSADDNLYGDDQPDRVNTLYSEHLTWLHA